MRSGAEHSCLLQECSAPLLTHSTNTLAVGATGMLAPAVRELARTGKVVVVARGAEQFARLSGSKAIFGVNANWEDSTQLTERLSQTLFKLKIDALSYAILWIHSAHRPRVIQALDALCARETKFVVIFGTNAISEQDHHTLESIRARGRRITEVFLGKVYTETGWRWLQDEEISRGALSALISAAHQIQVGEDAQKHDGGRATGYHQ